MKKLYAFIVVVLLMAEVIAVPVRSQNPARASRITCTQRVVLGLAVLALATGRAIVGITAAPSSALVSRQQANCSAAPMVLSYCEANAQYMSHQGLEACAQVDRYFAHYCQK